MDKLNMMSKDGVQENIEKIKELFPNAVTEVLRDGKPMLAVDFDVLKQEMSSVLIDDKEERYQFTWPDKKKSVLLANTPISATLRPCKEESVDFDNTENLYIEGDNLDVLKLLQETYLGKIKMIYIDPPYNTGNDFVYEDDFTADRVDYLANSGQYDDQGNRLFQNTEANGRFHTDWLNMIYPRLKLARDLLSDDGVIFISIDDNEQANLKKLCDEVFGEDNFVASMIWQQRKGGGNDSKYIAKDHEYIHVYAKNISNLPDNWRIEQSEEYLKRYKECDENGKKYYWDTLVRNGLQNPIIITIQTPDSKEITINSQWSKERVLEGLKNGTVRFTKTSNGWSLHHKVYMGGGQVLRSILMDCGNNRSAVVELTELFGELYFDYPKPSQLVKMFAKLCTNKDSIILDFFSGSATTAHAVMQLNAEDGGNRKFIMVQLPEKCDEKSEAYKAGYKNICEIGKERIRRAGKKIKEENPLTTANLDTGFRVLKLDSSNMKPVYYKPEDYTQDLLSGLEDNIKEDRTPMDLLFQVMLELGKPLSAKIEEKVIGGKNVFVVNDDDLIACFDSNITEEVVKQIALMKPLYAVFRDSSMANDSLNTNFEQIFATYSPNTTRKVL